VVCIRILLPFSNTSTTIGQTDNIAVPDLTRNRFSAIG
jgi:hypothetical protein